MAARKIDDWKTRILRDAERRYMREIIRPVLASLAGVRTELKAKMSKDKKGVALQKDLLKAELERVDSFETRVKKHADNVRHRLALRVTKG